MSLESDAIHKTWRFDDDARAGIGFVTALVLVVLWCCWLVVGVLLVM